VDGGGGEYVLDMAALREMHAKSIWVFGDGEAGEPSSHKDTNMSHTNGKGVLLNVLSAADKVGIEKTQYKYF
jgi:hypothetical protein